MTAFRLLAVICAALALATGCGPKSKGAVIGSAAGAAIGGPVGQVGGAIVGVAVEEMIDDDDDEAKKTTQDSRPIAYALETNQHVQWSNPKTGYSYQVDPMGTRLRDGHQCRDFRMVTQAPRTQGQPQAPAPQVAFGTACRDSKGSWDLQG